jgi:hypothetical protein
MSIFSAAVYLDKLALGAGDTRFKERVVVADSGRIET